MEGIDLVVCNYRTPGDLEAFCYSLLDYRPSVPWSLTIVNVCPTAADMDVADWAAKDDHIRQRTFAENVGYARSCNAAAVLGNSDVLALFNADVGLTPGAVDECYEAMIDHPDWGVLGPRQVDDDDLLTHAGIFGTQEAPTHRAWHQPDHQNYADVKPAVTVSGAAYFVRRRAWQELTKCPLYRDVASDAEGAFLPTDHYCEETWCSYHATAHGWGVIYYGPVKIVHRWHQASEIGGWADQQFPISQAYFRKACEHHSICHN